MNILFEGPVSTHSGYGSHARDLVRVLIKKYPDSKIDIIPSRWGGTPQNFLKDPRDVDIISRLIKAPLTIQPDIYMQVTIPNEFRKIGKFNIGITAGIETTRCHSDWIEGLNRMDLIIATSEHSKKTLIDTEYDKKDKRTGDNVGILKCNTTIDVLFEGVDLTTYYKTEELDKGIKETLDKIPEEFCFLLVGHWMQGRLGHDRKDVGMTVKTFIDTFKNTKSPPALILKSSGASFSTIDRRVIMEKLISLRGNNDNINIYLLHGELTNDEMNSLYNHDKIKAMVTFTHGEGYGRPMAEFAITDKPIIASAWSGQMDFLDDRYCVMLPGELKDVDISALQNKIIIKDSKWFFADYEYASVALKEVYTEYDKCRNKAKKQGDLIRNKFSFDKMCDKFKEIIDERVPKFPSEIKLKLPKLRKLNPNKNTEEPKVKLPKLKKE